MSYGGKTTTCQLVYRVGAQESRILGWDDHNLLAGTVRRTGGSYLTEGRDDHNLLAGTVRRTGGSYLTEGRDDHNLLAGTVGCTGGSYLTEGMGRP